MENTKNLLVEESDGDMGNTPPPTLVLGMFIKKSFCRHFVLFCLGARVEEVFGIPGRKSEGSVPKRIFNKVC